MDALRRLIVLDDIGSAGRKPLSWESPPRIRWDYSQASPYHGMDVCLAASAMVFAMLTGERRLECDSPVSENRGDGAIGCSLSRRRLLVEVDEDVSLEELLAQCGERIQEIRGLGRIDTWPSRPAAVLIDFLTVPDHPERWRRVPPRNTYSSYDLEFVFRNRGQDLEWYVNGSPAWSMGQLKSFGSLVGATLERLVENGARTVREVIADVVKAFPAVLRGREYPSEDLADLTDVLNEALGTYRERVAVRHGGKTWTYGDLDEASGRVCQLLRDEEEGCLRPVAVWGERGFAYIANVLGAVRGRVPFLPVAPDDPIGRLQAIVSSSGAQSALVPAVAGEAAVRQLAKVGVRVIGRLGGWPTRDSELGPTYSRDCAYVLYTSGSTGRPKGAMVSRAGMLNHLKAKVRDLHLSKDDRIAQTARGTFDISIWQMLAPLLVGAQCVVVDDSDASDPSRLSTRCEENDITVLEVVPSLLTGLIECPIDRLRAVRVLMSTGERLQVALARRVLTRMSGVQVWNAYGPTECADDVTHHLVSLGDLGRSSIPLGTPIQNCEIQILGPSGDLRPVEAWGEIVVSGPPVGLGYTDGELRGFDLLAGELPRRYRTGDEGRVTCDGLLEYRGRLDTQLKVGGLRIEPGEIERLAVETGMVEECAVVLRGQRLLAFVTLMTSASAREAREALEWAFAKRLPDAMRPREIHVLPSLPMTQNGKVDRVALTDLNVEEWIVQDSEGDQLLQQLLRDVVGGPQGSLEELVETLCSNSILRIEFVARAHRMGLGAAAERVLQGRSQALSGITNMTLAQMQLAEEVSGEPRALLMARAFHLNEELAEGIAEDALVKLFAAHPETLAEVGTDTLGRMFVSQRGGVDLPIRVEYGVGPAQLSERCRAIAAEVYSRRGGPGMHFILAGRRAGYIDWVVVLASKLLLDGVGWTILFADLVQSLRGAPLRPSTSSAREWEDSERRGFVVPPLRRTLIADELAQPDELAPGPVSEELVQALRFERSWRQGDERAARLTLGCARVAERLLGSPGVAAVGSHGRASLVGQPEPGIGSFALWMPVVVEPAGPLPSAYDTRVWNASYRWHPKDAVRAARAHEASAVSFAVDVLPPRRELRGKGVHELWRVSLGLEMVPDLSRPRPLEFRVRLESATATLVECRFPGRDLDEGTVKRALADFPSLMGDKG